MTAPSMTIALAVDDSEAILKSLERILARRFDEMHTATTPAEAEEILAAHPVTHLICDFRLGDDLPVGTELITDWCGRYPGIERAVIVSGSLRKEIVAPVEVDQVLGKPVSLPELMAALKIS